MNKKLEVNVYISFNGEDIDVVTKEGGHAHIYYAETWVSMYYQFRLIKGVPSFLNQKNVFEGKTQFVPHHDLPNKSIDIITIQKLVTLACAWLNVSAEEFIITYFVLSCSDSREGKIDEFINKDKISEIYSFSDLITNDFNPKNSKFVTILTSSGQIFETEIFLIEEEIFVEEKNEK